MTLLTNAAEENGVEVSAFEGGGTGIRPGCLYETWMLRYVRRGSLQVGLLDIATTYFC